MQLSLVSYLDSHSTKQIRELQQIVSEVTGAKASLTSWQPHITLGDGIDVTKQELKDVIDEIQQVGQSTHSFEVTISGFSSLDSRPIGIGEQSTPYALFIDVAASQELLGLVAKIDEVTNARSIWYPMSRPYLPHVTLAFRDLNEVGYKNGLDYLNDKYIYLTSLIDHIALVQKLPDSDVELTRIPLSQY